MGYGSVECRACGGTGKRTDPNPILDGLSCVTCFGTGKRRCPRCDGRGEIIGECVVCREDRRARSDPPTLSVALPGSLGSPLGEETEDAPPARSAAAELGSKGGKARAKALSKRERSEIAKKAARSRWRSN